MSLRDGVYGQVGREAKDRMLVPDSSHSLKLQCRNATRESFDDDDHLPRPQMLSGSPLGAALGVAIVLRQTSTRIRRGANVQSGVSDTRSEEIAAVECRDGFVMVVVVGLCFHAVVVLVLIIYLLSEAFQIPL